MTDEEKLHNAMHESNQLGPGIQALAGALAPGLQGIYHAHEDWTEPDSDMPNRTPRIFGGALAGLLGGVGIEALRSTLTKQRPDLLRAAAGMTGGSAIGAGLGAAFYNKARNEYIRELKKRIEEKKHSKD